MREIKFRAFYKDGVDGTKIRDIKQLKFSRLGVLAELDGGGDVGESALMQFTGLKDKNGKEIYEGDLMTWENVKRTDGKPFVIEFSDDLYGEQYGGGTDYFSGFSFPTIAKDGEIIGNIWENKDLV